MANPVMTTLDQRSRERTPAGYPTMPGYTPGSGTGAQAGMGAYPPAQTVPSAPAPDNRPGSGDFSDFERLYTAAPAEATDRGRVTIDDIVMRTGALFALLLAAGAAGWFTVAFAPQFGMLALMGGLIVGLVLGIVNAVKRQPSPTLIGAYSLAEGLFLGALSAFVEMRFPGIVVQAVLATVAIFAVTLVLYRMRVVRSSPKMQRILMIGMTGLLVYYGSSILLQMLGVVSSPLGTQSVFGIPLGILVGLVALVLAVMSLISDFDIAERCVAAGMPREVAWSCAFGLIVTLVWLYVELLRLLQYVRLASD